MPPSDSPRIAVIADAHFHDLYGDYGFPGVAHGDRHMAVRMLADTARSTRVFNESDGALRFTLDDIAARGIRHVVLLGDYSDDGQVATVAGVRRVLDDYSSRFGMKFYATVGNHDIFGEHGRHRSKRFLTATGDYSVATSDPDVTDAHARTVDLTSYMYCEGYPEGLGALPDVGFFRRAGDLHWETPFGEDDDLEARRYEVRSSDGLVVRRLVDASYLTEPFPGVWLLMIDANVFEPVSGVAIGTGGDLADSTSAGWNAMLRHKQFIFDWMRDVADRANRLGKCLLAFSHYPAIDPLDDTLGDELALLGPTSFSDRIPVPDVARALMDVGINIHFSGHLHVNDTARVQRDDAYLVNIGMPSLVAFPCAYKIITPDEEYLHVETVSVGDMPLDPALLGLYRTEVSRTGLKTGKMLEAGDYGTFLYEHLGHLVGRRFLKREWPRDLVSLLQTLSLADVALLATEQHAVPVSAAVSAVERLRLALQGPARLQGMFNGDEVTLAAMASVSMLSFLADWYRLRMGSELALDWIDDERLALYAAVVALYRKGPWEGKGGLQARFSLLFRMYGKFISGLPSRNFRIDLSTGSIVSAGLER
jgi:3',5'-cyclic AMP phosphodiesterase CpdA